VWKSEVSGTWKEVARNSEVIRASCQCAGVSAAYLPLTLYGEERRWCLCKKKRRTEVKVRMDDGL
jgi:hypothetical protein